MNAATRWIGGAQVAGVACGLCGTGLRVGAKFCDACGASTAGRGAGAEYKQVTVLFADVVRSMDLAAAVDAERLRAVMTDVVERSAAVVRRYGGGSVEYTGDGLMALFGAPTALEDHAIRGCLAALAIQQEAVRLAGEVAQRDGVTLRLRVGLNSGRVIAGEIGSGSFGYTATGETIGFAQRMESAAPPGGVLLSESTARLVEHTAMLAEPEWVRIKGVEESVRARRLIGFGPRDAPVSRAEATLIGRRWELAALQALVDRAVGGRGAVVNVVGPPGIGKSRMAREVAALATDRGAEVVWAFCESHERDISFHAITALLRASSGIIDLDDQAARAKVRERVPPGADPQDLLLLDDLLGIADPAVSPPQIDVDARRRRLTALIDTVWLERTGPSLFVIEDAHWIDAASESLLADLLTLVARTSSTVVVTSRPEYAGALTRLHGAQTIALAPLSDSDTAALLSTLLGTDPSVADLAPIIAERAAGNPFFAEEIVRELAQRDVLTGDPGGYVCGTDVTEISVPATVEAAIEARIDLLSTAAKQTVFAASVIGARFDADLLAALGIDAVFDELLDNDLIDRMQLAGADYAFRHPLIRAVAYESQLRSDRTDLHRRLATAIQERAPGAVEENAALIAEHLESAGDLPVAHGWHMRAATWSNNRDIAAARLSWQRAADLADQLPPDHPDRLPMRIAPRTMLCATGWQAFQDTRGRFDELRELCTAAGDNISLAFGMIGLATELLFAGRSPEASRMLSEQMARLESIDDPIPTIALAFIAFNCWFDAGEFYAILRFSDAVIILTGGDPVMGAEFGFGSPLAAALAWRGVARWWLGRPGWTHDLRDAHAVAQHSDPTTLGMVTGWTYGLAIQYGVLRADDQVLRAIEDAMRTAEGSSSAAFSIVSYALGIALLQRDTAADQHRGLETMIGVRDIWLREPIPFLVPLADLLVAREGFRGGEADDAVTAIRHAADELYRAGRPFLGVLGDGILVEALLARSAEGDLAEAQAVIDRMARLRADEDWAMRDITLLRLRALLARASGDDPGYRELAQRYRAMAQSLGFQGHLAWAEAMITGDPPPAAPG